MVKIDDYVAFLEYCGNPVHMCVRQFLTEYGRMKVNNLLLLMAENGQVFGAESTELYPVGRSGEDAIEKMCTGTVFPEDLE